MARQRGGGAALPLWVGGGCVSTDPAFPCSARSNMLWSVSGLVPWPRIQRQTALMTLLLNLESKQPQAHVTRFFSTLDL